MGPQDLRRGRTKSGYPGYDKTITIGIGPIGCRTSRIDTFISRLSMSVCNRLLEDRCYPSVATHTRISRVRIAKKADTATIALGLRTINAPKPPGTVCPRSRLSATRRSGRRTGLKDVRASAQSGNPSSWHGQPWKIFAGRSGRLRRGEQRQESRAVCTRSVCPPSGPKLRSRRVRTMICWCLPARLSACLSVLGGPSAALVSAARLFAGRGGTRQQLIGAMQQDVRRLPPYDGGMSSE
jgi:hypothetical protein